MSRKVRTSVTTASENATEELAQRLGANLPGGTTVGLVGELGCGKTRFVRGLAAGLGIDPEDVASPTFVYLVQYEGGRLPLHHADLYRLDGLSREAAEEAMEAIGLCEAIAGPGITAVEWWDRYVGPQPERLILVEFSIETVDLRKVELTLYGAGLVPAARAVRAEKQR